MMSFIVLLFCLIPSLNAFKYNSVRSISSIRSSSKIKTSLKGSVFDDAVKKWADTYPAVYSVGWGPTTLAERWNGRHAMFGWVSLVLTGYARGHDLIPEPDMLLDIKEWGTLAYIYGGSISNERAIVIVGHLHLLFFSICAAVAPLSFQDKMYLSKGEIPEPASGLIPKASPGLTRSAELINGRLAMLGIVVMLLQSFVTQTPVLDVINNGLGGLLF